MAEPWTQFQNIEPVAPWDRYKPAAPATVEPWKKFQQPATATPSLLSRLAGTTSEDIAYARAPARETKGLGANIAEAFQSGLQEVKAGLQEVKSADVRERYAGVLPKAPVDIASGAFNMLSSPISGTVSTIGQQAEKLTGGLLKAEDIGAALSPIMPGKGKLPLSAAPPAGPAATAARNAAGFVEKIFSPETVDADAKLAVSAIREAGGRAARATATTEVVLEPAWKKVSAMPVVDRLDFIDYVEGRSAKYAGLLMKDPELQTLGDTLKGVFDERMQKLQALPSTSQMSFIQDYFPHLWKDQKKAQSFVAGFGKEGTGRFTKGRTIPTVADGIAAGLEPVTTDPLAATLRYVANADRFIATNEVFDTARNANTVKYFRPGKAPDNWQPVAGRLGEKSTPAGPLVAHAPEGWARIYNNFISRGFAEHGEEYGKAYDALRHGSNAVTALELGLSGYHTLTMAQESMVNSVANAVGYARKGRPIEAVKSLGRAAIAPVGYARTGKKIQNIYLGLSPGSKELTQVTDLLTEAGGRAKGARHAPDYDFSTTGSYITALKRGQLQMQLTADRAEAMGSPLGAAKVATKHVGRVLDTVASPIFQTYIPLIKNGAFYENMSAWLKTHPGAAHEEQLNAARQIWDSVDNRFGELVQDNIFINKVMKQIGMLSLRSWSWFIGGDVREIGGAMRDVVRAPFKKPTGTGPQDVRWTQKMDYAIALPLVYGTLSALYQALKTGQAPESVQDLLAPRTGGTDPATGQPERLIMPGYMKDVFGFYAHPMGELTAKQASAPRMAKELLTNKDWRGDPIFQSNPENAPEWLKQFWNYATQNVGPISVRAAVQGKKTGSNLSMPEQVLGVRTAPRYLTDPESYERMMKGVSGKGWRGKIMHEKRQQRLYE